MPSLTVTRILDEPSIPATVLRFEGECPAGKVTFAVDHRAAAHLAEALASGEEPEVQVPSWAILGFEEAHPQLSL